MADWNGTLKFSPEQVTALEAFIREPDTRTTDIFDHGTLPVDEATHIDWIIKHDLFEGVVIHLSLMAADGTRYLAGTEAILAETADVFQTLTIDHEGRLYSVTIEA